MKVNFSPVKNISLNSQNQKRTASSNIISPKTNYLLPPFNKSYYAVHVKENNQDNLPDEKTQKERFDFLVENDISETFARAFSRLPEDKYARAIEVLKKNVFEENVEEVIELDDDEYKNVHELLDIGADSESVAILAKLKGNDYKRAKDFLAKGIDASDVIHFVKLRKSQEGKAIEYLKAGQAPYIAAKYARMNKHQRDMASYFLFDGLESDIAFSIAELNNKQFTRALSIMEKGIIKDEAYDLAKLSSKNYKKIDKLRELNIPDSSLAVFSEFDSESLSRALELLKNGVLADYIPDILDIQDGKMERDEYEEYRALGYGENGSFKLSLMDENEIEKIKEFIGRNPEIEELLKDNYEPDVVELQNTDNSILIMSKEAKSENGSDINLVQIFFDDGTVIKNKSEENKKDGSISRIYKGSDIFQIKYAKFGEIREMIQYIRDEEHGGIAGVLISKASELLEGCFETKYYDINDFKTSDDISKVDASIEDSVTSEGETISSVRKNPNGSITYTEDWTYGDYTTKRNYTEKRSKTGDLVYSEYSYNIEDKNNNSLMNIDRTFKRNSDGSSTNIINGNTYNISYDDSRKTVIISDGKNRKELDFSTKLPLYSQNTLWEKSIKYLPVDTLLTIHKNINKWNYCINEDSAANGVSKTLSSGTHTEVITHEAGHLKCYENEDLAENPELNQIYIDEMGDFMEVMPHNEQEFIDYFSLRANMASSNGIDEFIAETNILLSTYGVNYSRLKTRSQLLERYFPKTICKIAELTGKTSCESLLNSK